ncbi:MAG: alpha/beta hydrolase [Erysipelotrichaceae bacterium]|nr:alpha/beta hydrolase [Erysipelotrichaceae bacterium]MBQ1788162.1 alpha/beta hydrolase [Erysipelotrichaceae bacterium]
MLEIFETEIPQLIKGEKRKVYVYVPDFEGSFPVLYMFDGHNVFLDEEASYGKSWGMLEFLEENEVPLMVVGVECNHHDEREKCGGRLSEYSPFSFEDHEWGYGIKGRGKITMNWFVKELKPYIDDNYPTLPDRNHTFIAGSSMGGLMTLYAMSQYNRVFSKGAALSPSINFAPKKVLDMIEKTRYRRNTVIYMDYGENEMRHHNAREIYADVTQALINKGVLLESRIVPKGNHNEASWEKQIPFFLDTFFYE